MTLSNQQSGKLGNARRSLSLMMARQINSLWRDGLPREMWLLLAANIKAR